MEQRLLLDSIPWVQYEAIARAFAERPHLKITYVDGSLTIVSPSRRHDWFEKVLSKLVETIAEESGVEIEVSGHATYRSQVGRSGVEGDQAYYLGDHAVIMRGPVEIDLTGQPPPDLVIEVEVTHPADDAILAWGRIGVPEIWRYDVDRERFRFLLSRGDGSYEDGLRSRHFPNLLVDDVIGQLRESESAGWSAWARSLRLWIRDVYLTR